MDELESIPKPIKRIGTAREGEPDDVLLCCASYEERCTGALRILEKYKCRQSYVFVYNEPDTRRDGYLDEMKQRLSNCGETAVIPTSKEDPFSSFGELNKKLMEMSLDRDQSIITIDITTFTKKHLLLLLRNLDMLGFWDSIRLIYSEPGDYVANDRSPNSFGLRQICALPGFVHTQPLNKPILLLIFLGYESDRAWALFDNLDPNETMLIIPRPAYRSNWEGRTERLNKNLINLLGQQRISYAHSIDSSQVASSLKAIFSKGGKYSLDDWDCYIAPLGTKPQTVGLYLFWRERVGSFSVIYAQLSSSHLNLDTEGVGQVWLLKNATPAKKDFYV